MTSMFIGSFLVLLLVQDNEVKLSFIGNVATIYVNRSLRTTQTIPSNIDEVSALDVYLLIARNDTFKI